MTKIRRHWLRLLAFLLLIGVLVAGTLLYLRPLPTLTSTTAFTPPVTKASPSLNWPATGQAAVGAVGYGVLATNGNQTPQPTASVAKVITALAVLEQHPLKLGEQGPTITLTDADVASYDQYASEDGSVEPVQSGEQLTEYQALETMLLPSANNMADSLARWAYGSLQTYSVQANLLLRTWGMNHTTVGVDASGFDPSTVSTASDLVSLGVQAMQNPVLAQIVSQSAATVPVAGTIYNTNILLQQAGLVGIKTGNTDQAGGVFIGATKQTVGGQNLTLISAVVGMPDLQTALATSVPLLNSAKANFVETIVAKAGIVVGTYNVPWGQPVQAVTQKDVSLVTWKGADTKSTIALTPIHAPQNTTSNVGILTFTSSSNTATSPIVLKQNLPKPSFWWRIVRHNL